MNKTLKKQLDTILRPETLGEGSLPEIARILILPAYRHKPANISLVAWLEEVFGVESRPIRKFLATEDFEMPGPLRVTSKRLVQGIGFRSIKKGTALWARFDASMPDFVEVEGFVGRGRSSHVFQVDSHDWARTVRPKLERIEEDSI